MTRQTALHQQELEAALVAERNYSHALLQALPLAVCTVDVQGRIVSLNAEGERILGWSETSCRGHDLHELIGCRIEQPEPEQMLCPVRRVLDTGKPAWATHTSIWCRDRSAKSIEYKCVPLSSARGLGAIFCFRDLSNQLQLEKDLLRLASMPEESPSPIVELDGDATMIYANKVMMELLDQYGFSSDGFPAVLPTQVARIAHECLRTGESVRGVEVSTADRQYEWTFFPIPEIGLLRGYGIDLTERKKAELELKRARDAALDASRIKSEFLANVSHELRTPLNGIIGMTALTLDSELAPAQREYLGMVKASASTLLELINDILDFSKIEAGKLELELAPFGLRQNLSEMLKPLALRAYQKGLELICDVRSNVPDGLIGDIGRLRQILVNLVDNALKFTHQGEVIVGIEVQTQRTDDVCLHITVQDTGIGIPPDKQQMIFEPFTQADGSATRVYGGTGLGLAIVAQLVNMMAGDLWVESAGTGAGSTFHLTPHFGVRREAAASQRTMPALPAGRRTLLVQHNAMSRRVVSTILQELDLEVVEASSGSAAIMALEHIPEGIPQFALIVVDAYVPDTDGVDLVRYLHEQSAWHETPLLILTTAGQASEAEHFHGLHRAGFVCKPVFSHEVVRALTAVLHMDTSPDAEDSPVQHATNTAEPHTLRVLLAEDNLVNQKVALRFLEKWGYTVVIANNGREAVEAVARETFDVVLMDIQMPEMNGFEATATIREHEQGSGTRLPIIAMTAHAMPGDRERCLAQGMDAYLSKPIEPHELYQTLNRLSTHAVAVASQTVIGRTSHVVFDRAALLTRLEGDAELLDELIGLFLEDCPQRLTSVHDALARGDMEDLAQVAHTLKGAAGNLCAPLVQDAAKHLEAAARQGDVQAASDVFIRLEQEVTRLEAELTALTRVRQK
jgi:PAS domain S-box-containing protein